MSCIFTKMNKTICARDFGTTTFLTNEGSGQSAQMSNYHSVYSGLGYIILIISHP